jgi:hypothetical protein
MEAAAQHSDCYLLAETVHGPITQKQIDELEKRHAVFFCGICSTDRQRVYHNLIGRHNHANLFPPGRFKGLIEKPRPASPTEITFGGFPGSPCRYRRG